MNLTVFNNENILTMNSREIAELTGKRHSDVLRDLDRLIETLNADLRLGFKSTTYQDLTGKSNRMFNLDKEATICLVAGYDANVRMKIIKRWQELENQVQKLKVVSPAEMIMLQAQWNLDQERKLLAVEKIVEDQAVQLEEVSDDIAMVVKEIEGVKKLVLDSSISLSEIYADENAVFEIGEVAGMLIGSGYFLKEKDFRLYLLEKKLCYKHGQNHYYPMARLLKEGYVKVIPVKVGTRVFSATHFTPRGISWIVKRLQKEQQRELDLGYVESDSVSVLVDSSPTTVVRGF